MHCTWGCVLLRLCKYTSFSHARVGTYYWRNTENWVKSVGAGGSFEGGHSFVRLQYIYMWKATTDDYLSCLSWIARVFIRAMLSSIPPTSEVLRMVSKSFRATAEQSNPLTAHAAVEWLLHNPSSCFCRLALRVIWAQRSRDWYMWMAATRQIINCYDYHHAVWMKPCFGSWCQLYGLGSVKIQVGFCVRLPC